MSKQNEFSSGVKDQEGGARSYKVPANKMPSENKVRSSVRELLKRNIDKHADIWAELAKH